MNSGGSEPTNDNFCANLVASFTEAIVGTDLSGTITTWNLAAEALFGYSAKETVGCPIDLIIPENRADEMRDAMDRIGRREACSPFDTTLLARDGGTPPVSISVSPVFDNAHNLVGAASLIRDQGPRSKAVSAQRFLAEAGKILSSSLDFEATLANIARLAVPELADWVALDVLLPNGEVDRQAVVHRDPAKAHLAVELRAKYPVKMDADSGIGFVMRTGTAELYSRMTNEALRQVSNDEEHYRAYLAVEMHSIMFVPLTSRGRLIGALTFVASEIGRYDEEDLALAVEIGRRAGLAADHALLFAAAQGEINERIKAERELRLLHDAGRLLARTLEPSAIFDSLQSLVSEVMECENLIVSEYDASSGQIHCAYAWIEGEKPDVSEFPAVQLDRTGKGMQSSVIISGKSELILNVAERMSQPGTTYYNVEKDGEVNPDGESNTDTKSILMVPLKLEDKVIGVVQVMSPIARAYDENDLRILERIVIQMAAASRNAALFQRTRAESQERKIAEERYRSLVSATTSLVWSANAAGEFVEPQKAWEDYTGQPWEEHQGYLWMNSLEPSDRIAFSRRWHKADDDECAIFEAEGRLWSASEKRYRHIVAKSVPLRNEEGKIREWVGTVTDVDEQRRAENRSRFLLNLNERIRLVTDPDEVLQGLVEALGEHLHLSRCNYGIIDFEKGIYNIVHEYQAEGVASTIGVQPIRNRDVLHELELGITRVVTDTSTDPTTSSYYGPRYRDMNIGALITVPILKANTLEGILSVQSFTAREWEPDIIALAQEAGELAWLAAQTARANEEIRTLNSELEERVKDRTAELEAANREMEGFTYTVSHDLRGPLRAILSTSRILNEDFGENVTSDMEVLLERQAKAAGKLARLIDDLLRLSRLSREPVHKEICDLSMMATEIVEDLRDRYAGTQFSIEPNLSVKADPRLIRLALENLLENAAKFSSKTENPRVSLTCSEQTIEIWDNGVGFDMIYSEKLFVPFERLVSDEQFPGTGVGLANVKRIMERHGGKVWAESELGHGASFYFRFPSELE